MFAFCTFLGIDTIARVSARNVKQKMFDDGLSGFFRTLRKPISLPATDQIRQNQFHYGL
jgi:hypothetical protein